MWPDLDVLCRLLGAGINVSSTAGFITGRALPPADLERLRDAALRGRSTLFGTGVNPGFANFFALVSTQICDRVDSVSVTESVDSTGYASKDTEESVGYGMALDDPGLVAATRDGTAVFEEAVALIADALGVELDEITFDADYGAASEDRDLGYMRIPKGTVSSIDGRWRGRAFGRDVVVAHFQWLKGAPEDAPFKIRHGYYVEVDGEPSVRSQFQIRPGRGLGRARLHGPGNDHDGDAGRERHPRRRRGRAGDRDVRDPAARLRAGSRQRLGVARRHAGRTWPAIGLRRGAILAPHDANIAADVSETRQSDQVARNRAVAHGPRRHAVHDGPASAARMAAPTNRSHGERWAVTHRGGRRGARRVRNASRSARGRQERVKAPTGPAPRAASAVGLEDPLHELPAAPVAAQASRYRPVIISVGCAPAITTVR